MYSRVTEEYQSHARAPKIKFYLRKETNPKNKNKLYFQPSFHLRRIISRFFLIERKRIIANDIKEEIRNETMMNGTDL
jgi:hypothetical protein